MFRLPPADPTADLSGVLLSTPIGRSYFPRIGTARLSYNPQYLWIIARTVWLAALATIISALLSFPVAYFIAGQKASMKATLIYLVTLPFWVSMIVRVYAWLLILGNDGVVETSLKGVGLVTEMDGLLFNDGATLLGLVYSYIPLMILPVYASVEKLDRAYIEAAHDLYASRWITLRRVILPLTAPGLAAGAILVFVPCLGAVLEPTLLGGGKFIMMGSLIQTQFGTARNWPFGSAIAIVLMLLVMIVLIVNARRAGAPLGAAGMSRKPNDVARYPGAGLVTGLFFIYLYLPIAVVILYSFNENRLISVWTGFSLKWYASALANRNLVDALQTSLIVASIATVIATSVALMAALVLASPKPVRYRKLSETVVNLPLLLPEIVVAVAVLILFSQLGVSHGLTRLIIAHSAFCIPFAFLPIRARLQGLEPAYDEAARDLYASGWTAFRRVTLPLILPGVFAGAMLAFVMSLDDFITSNMLSAGGTTTLPVYIFGLIKIGTTPELNAISTLIILFSLVISSTALWLTFRSGDLR